jgi:hypothetical protein
MSSNTQRGHRNQRNNPYLFDSWAVAFHRTAAGVAWRWRTELLILSAAGAAIWRLSRDMSLIWAAITPGAIVLGLLAIPGPRRYVTRRFWCVLARHRIQRLCYEARLHTRSGRLPLVLWTRPTKVGERAHLLCRAGICAEDFEAHIGELRAACYAREARVTRNRQWSHLVTIDIIRRDTLAAARHVPSPLMTTRPRPLTPEPPAVMQLAVVPPAVTPLKVVPPPRWPGSEPADTRHQ